MAAGAPLGTGAGAPRVTADRLGPGDVLVLYTDGLVERPGRTLDDSLEALARTAVAAGHEAVEDDATVPTAQVDRIAALTVERMGWTGGGHTDDATLLAVQRTAEPLAPLTLEVAPDPRRLGRMRRAVGAWLENAGVGEDDAMALVHAVGEAVTNAIEHAYPEPPADGVGARVRAVLDDEGRMHVTVADTGRWLPAPDDPGGRGRGLMMMRGLVEHVDVTAGPTGTTVTMVAPVHREVSVGSYDDEAAVSGLRGVDRELTTAEPEPGVLAVAGPIDTGTVERFRHGLLAAARGGARGLTVDLDAVTVFSSSAVQAIHELRGTLPGLRLRAGPGQRGRPGPRPHRPLRPHRRGARRRRDGLTPARHPHDTDGGAADSEPSSAARPPRVTMVGLSCWTRWRRSACGRPGRRCGRPVDRRRGGPRTR